MRTRSPISRADPRIGARADAAAGRSDGDVLEKALVAPGVAAAGACDAGDPEGVAGGAGLAAAAQPVTNRPTTTVVANRECEERIP
jgi:hypothetical protein